jgi:MFS family permease
LKLCASHAEGVNEKKIRSVAALRDPVVCYPLLVSRPSPTTRCDRSAEEETGLAPAEIEQSLRSTQREAVAWAVMAGLTDSFMTPYALALGASPFQAGLLSSFRSFVVSVTQLKSADALRWFRSRKRMVLWTAGLQAFLWIPLAVAAPVFGRLAVPVLIGLYTLGTTSAAFGGPAWGSLVSEYLSPQARGRFFGRRSRSIGGWTTVSGLAAGGLLQASSARPLFGFGVLCAAAAVCRATSCWWLGKLKEGRWHEPVAAKFSFARFLRQTPTSNFAQFTLCMTFMSFAANLAAPYFAVYLLSELHYGYLTYTLVVLGGSGMAFLTSTRWGHVGDTHGNLVVLKWTMLGVSVLPLLWLLSPHPLWLFVTNVIAGLLWGGANLSMLNFVYDAATPAKRARCLAYFNVMNGCGASLGALAGGWLLVRLGQRGFVTLFCCSAALRLVAGIGFWIAVREVRPVGQVPLRELVSELVGRRSFASLRGLRMKRGAKGEVRYPSAETIAERASHAHSSSAFDAFELE